MSRAFMAIATPGLGECKTTSLSPLLNALKKLGGKIKVSDCTHVMTFQDRIDAIKKEVPSTTSLPIYLIGNSAGGLASIIVAENLGKCISGIILQSPAMPVGIMQIGFPLMSVMMRYTTSLFFGEPINLNNNDFQYIVLNEVREEVAEKILSERTSISRQEATTLGMSPPRLPILNGMKISIISGGDDRLILPCAYTALARELNAEGSHVKHVVIPNAGHLPLLSKSGRNSIQTLIGHVFS